MKYARLLGGAAVLSATAFLSGCVVAPLGSPYYAQPYSQGVYGPGPGYVEPAPVMVAPPPVSFGIYGGYYRPRYHRHWR